MNTDIETQSYKIELEIFEGPLDLLLYLIKRDEIDIYDIPISLVTQQYLDYLEIMQILDLKMAGEFILMAATLMYIKSKMLLPAEERVEEDEEEMEDPRSDLVRQLLEYKKFKEVAGDLKEIEESHEKTFSRTENEVPQAQAGEKRLVDVGIFDLLTAFSDVLKRTEPVPPEEILDEEVSIGEKIVLILQVLDEHGRARFSSFFEAPSSRMEVVATFLALLELMRQKKVAAFQKNEFGEIEIILRDGD